MLWLFWVAFLVWRGWGALQTPDVPEMRRPDLRQFDGAAVPGPSTFDPVIEIESEAAPSYSLGTAFSIDDGGHWLTARHVVRGCNRVGVQTGRRQGMYATDVVIHPGADVAVITTERGRPPLPLSESPLAKGQDGFHFGFPQGEPGEVHSRLLGRRRLRARGHSRSDEPAIAWAEVRRVPAGLRELGGISGGPLLDVSGGVIGVTVASSKRRGRVITAAPVSLRQVLERAKVAVTPGLGVRFDPEQLAPEDFDDYGDELRSSQIVAKVLCWAD